MTDPLATADYPGIHIDYFESPYRKYVLNGDRVPSVSTILGVLNKEALPHWAAKVTREGCWELVRKDRNTRYLRRKWADSFEAIVADIGQGDSYKAVGARYAQVEKKDYQSAKASIVVPENGEPYAYLLPRNVYDFADSLKTFGLTHTQTTNRAADLGTDVHKVWQDWMESQKLPNASDYPSDRRPRIRALTKFIMEHHPECVETEEIVGSATHGFAGRLDTVVILRGGAADRGHAMVDLKNTKEVWRNTHFPQLAGYEIARRECGLQPSERQGILRLDASGEYELAWSDAEPEDFLVLLRAYKSQGRWKKR